jgi:hypothetical protein
MSNDKKCECLICKGNAEVRAIIERRNIDELIDLIKKLRNDWMEAEFDNSWYTAIMDGSWPTAKEQLTKALEKANYQLEIDKFTLVSNMHGFTYYDKPNNLYFSNTKDGAYWTYGVKDYFKTKEELDKALSIVGLPK